MPSLFSIYNVKSFIVVYASFLVRLAIQISGHATSGYLADTYQWQVLAGIPPLFHWSAITVYSFLCSSVNSLTVNLLVAT
jgi:hypothetical protein